MKTQLNLRISQDDLNKYKNLCKKNQINMSARLRNLINNDIILLEKNAKSS